MNSENRVLAGENEMTKLWRVIAMGWYLMGPPIDDKGGGSAGGSSTEMVPCRELR